MLLASDQLAETDLAWLAFISVLLKYVSMVNVK